MDDPNTFGRIDLENLELTAAELPRSSHNRAAGDA
eukprot:COSAG04_NODE_2834_length_3518_cov_3.351565_2_plen_35_part_00